MRTGSLNLVGGCLIVLGSIALSCSSASGPDEEEGGGSNSSVSKNESGAGGKSSSAGAKNTGATGGDTKSATGGSNSTGGGDDKGGSVGSGGKGSSGSNTSAGGKSGKSDAGTGTPGTGGKSGGGLDASTTGGKGGKAGASEAGRPQTDGSSSTGVGGSSTSADSGGGATVGGDPVKSAGCGKTPTLKTGDGQTLSVSGTDRTFNLKVPDPYDNSKPYRLIVAYHWMGGTANDVSKGGVTKPYYGLWDMAGGSTIFVAPQGTSNQWTNTNGVDVEFSRQLIEKLEGDFCIDSSRIFCEGFSMGGSMSYAMACGLPDKIRAVAVHSGGTMSGCTKHDKPVAYFMTHGTQDSVCKYPSFPMPPLMDFAKVDGCTSPDPSLSADAFEKLLPEPTSTAGVCLDFQGCKEGYPVRSCLFVGDHTPSPDGTSGWIPKESWKFISQF